MRLFLFITALLIMSGCKTQFFPPLRPAVIHCPDAHGNSTVMLSIAQSYNMCLVYDQYFDTSRLHTIVIRTFNTSGIDLSRLLDFMGNESVGFYVKNSTIHVYRRNGVIAKYRPLTSLEPY